MASRRFASVITFSAGTNTNSASLSTNFLISQGQATRSTLTFSRVIHFMLSLLCGYRRTSGVRKDENPVVCGGNHVDLVRRRQRRRVSAGAGRGTRAVDGRGINGSDKHRVPDRIVHHV